jgi:Binding-protein-dependent transport system inner membrane component
VCCSRAGGLQPTSPIHSLAGEQPAAHCARTLARHLVRYRYGFKDRSGGNARVLSYFFTTLSGIRSVDQALVDVARVVGATERQIFRYVMLPGAAAWVINGLKMSLPYALIGVIVGEFLISSSGLGYRLNFYSTSYNTNGTFAMLIVMMAVMMGLNSLMGLVERRAFRWRTETAGMIQTY